MHTPGPWQVYPTAADHGETTSICGGDCLVIASIPSAAWDDKAKLKGAAKADRANARLIAAAPDLLGAARFVMAFYDPGQTHLDTNAWKQAEASMRAAIAKAVG